ncbi:MAG: ion channel [Bacteroidota bacterium]|nr:ion channel [Bacteroidota bacterium]
MIEPTKSKKNDDEILEFESNDRNKVPNKQDDLGLGTKIVEKDARWVNPDGTFNVKREGIPWYHKRGVYHYTQELSWPKFIGMILLAYLGINLVFTILYLLIGTHQINGMGQGELGKFWEAFFFSVQTFTTVGYGGLSPNGFAAHIVASIESMSGWMGFAIAGALMFGRFSRPRVKILYSHNIIIAPYADGKGLMFRMVNKLDNQLIEVNVSVIMSINGTESQAGKRQFYQLKLERSKVDFFPTSWTVVHPINDESPMKNLSIEDLDNRKTEYLLLIKAWDESFNQTVYTKHSYVSEELVNGAKFKSMTDMDGRSEVVLHLDKINDIELLLNSEF